MKNKILLFIPMYNCEKQIVRVLGQLNEDVCQYLSEAVIVNNRSTDNGELAVQNYLNHHKLAIKVSILRNDENYNLGGSHKVAFQYAIEHDMDYVVCLHGDDQGAIQDFIPLFKRGIYEKYDCCLGARFMKGSSLKGYSKLRIWGNYGFNLLFSLAVKRKIYDLGAGLNMYKVEPLKSGYYFKFPDTLYFNDCMMLAYCYYNQKIKFVPITWREEDQVSNNRLFVFSVNLLIMMFQYIKGKQHFLESELRQTVRDRYGSKLIYDNKETMR